MEIKRTNKVTPKENNNHMVGIEMATAWEVSINKIYVIENKIDVLKKLRNDLEEVCEQIDIEIGKEYKKLIKE